jgi:hypothetical protein
MRTVGRRRWRWWLAGGIAALAVLLATAAILSQPKHHSVGSKILPVRKK